MIELMDVLGILTILTREVIICLYNIMCANKWVNIIILFAAVHHPVYFFFF